MALYIEQKVNNGDIVRYHRIGTFDINGNIVTATLDSYRTYEQRCVPMTVPVVSRNFTFIMENSEKIFEEAYDFIKKTPEFVNALQEEPKTTAPILPLKLK